MKKIFTLTLLLFYGFINGYGQTGIQGGDFEHWKLNTTYHYYDPDSSYFSTLNELASVGCSITTYRCDTAFAGNYSSRMVTGSLVLGPQTIIIPGVCGTLKVNMATSKAILGMPYPYGDSMPRVFSGQYKYYPVNNDSASAVILLSKWNSTLKKRDTIAFSSLSFQGITDTWTGFQTDVNYFMASTKPDSLTILLLSSAGFNIYNMLACQGQVGSTALFDNISLTGVNGFPLLLMPSVNVRLAPNPASSKMNVVLGSEVSNGYFEIFDTQARSVRTCSVNGTRLQISVSELPAGMYYYKLSKGNNLLNSGTFIVTR
jgi:hypothetical protein